jgi:hypothetical protein
MKLLSSVLACAAIVGGGVVYGQAWSLLELKEFINDARAYESNCQELEEQSIFYRLSLPNALSTSEFAALAGSVVEGAVPLIASGFQRPFQQTMSATSIYWSEDPVVRAYARAAHEHYLVIASCISAANEVVNNGVTSPGVEGLIGATALADLALDVAWLTEVVWELMPEGERDRWLLEHPY